MRRILAIGVLLGLVVVPGWGQIPQTMSYQGVLADAAGAPVADADYAITFKLFDVATGGTEIWLETHPTVATQGGVFSAVLGTSVPLDLPFDVQYWLEATVGAGPALSPRTALTAAPYSLNSRRTCPQGMVDAGGFCIQPETPYAFGLSWFESLDVCAADGLRLCSQGEVVNALRAGKLKEYPISERDAWYHTSTQAETSPGTGGENQVCDVQGNSDQVGHPALSVQCSHEKSWAAPGSMWRTTVCCY